MFRKMPSSPVALPLLAMMTIGLAGLGCGDSPYFFDDSNHHTNSSENSTDEGFITAHSPQLPNLSPDFPVATGATIDIYVESDRQTHALSVVDDEIFSSEKLSEEHFRLTALSPGTTSIEITTGPERTAPQLRVAEPVIADIEPRCDTLDFALALGGATVEFGSVWLTDHIYEGRQNVRAQGDERLYGMASDLFSVAPEGGLTIEAIDDHPEDIEIITGADEGEITITSPLATVAATMHLAHRESVDQLQLVRLENLEETDSPALRAIGAGAEPTLNHETNSRYYFLPHRFQNDRLLCESAGLPEYIATTQTPEVCGLGFLDFSDFTDEPEPADPKETLHFEPNENWEDDYINALARLLLLSPGTCKINLETYDDEGNVDLSESFEFDVEE